MSGLPHANLIHDLNLWKWAIGGGCMCFASAWHEEGDKLNGALFPVHKVNVSDSRDIKDIKHMELNPHRNM